MASRKIAAAALLCLLICTPSFSQSTFATVSGTMDDGTGAFIPGVSVSAKNNATGIVTTALSNETGAYNFPSLQPGTYTVSAQLSGFQTSSYTTVQLGNRDQVRLNF